MFIEYINTPILFERLVKSADQRQNLQNSESSKKVSMNCQLLDLL